MAILKDAMMPNLVQTIEGVPALIHGGPFANIAHGCNSVIATKTAMAYADWTVTEAGFGFDLGAEKFFDIKCRSAGLDTAAVVLVATVRALKRHGGVQGDLSAPDPAAVERGLDNLRKHVESIHTFTEVPVVALNRFHTDSEDEIAVVRRACEELGVEFAVSDHFGRGGEGAVELARAVVHHAEDHPSPFQPLYELDEPFKEKMRKIARLMYGADRVLYTKAADRDLALYERLGYGKLPLCVAKTPASLSDDPSIHGRPTAFDITVRNVLVSAGAGFLVPLLGDILRMPGLPKEPAAHHIDLVDGEIVGVAK
jgi:formate--tetrahydrofolate ligase